jgi:two-component system cell cycle sensor histidine kinase/response regulator CckA
LTGHGSAHGQSLSVLLLEHDMADAELNTAELTRAGMDVRVDIVTTKEEFLARLREGSHDIVLADYRLPTWTGMDAFRALREAGSTIPLILVTGTLGDERAVECVRAGVADYIIKDNLSRLPMAVRRAIDDQRVRDDRNHAVEALAASEARHRSDSARLRALMDHANDGISLLTPDGMVFDANSRICEMLGRPREQVVGHWISEFGRPETFAVKGAAFAEAVALGGGTVLGVELIQPTGKIVVADFSLSRVKVGAEEIVVSIGRDVTEQRLLQRQFLQAQKMEAIGRFAGGVAHDFNNLLTVILSYSDMLMDGLTAEDPRHDDLDQIRRAAVGAAGLTRQLLAFSRQEVVEPRLVSLEEVVANAEKMLKRVIGEDIDFVSSLNHTPTTVRIDPGQLEQIIMNLAVNARDAMPVGGKLTIETAVVELDSPESSTGLGLPRGRYGLLALSDTGTGMDAETQARIFEPFFTTKDAGKGTGLGLSTVYGIAKQHGGTVSAYSEPGRGTTFKVYLPLAAEGLPAGADRPGMTEAPRGTEVILYAEDDAAVRSVVRGILQRCGYTVLEAPDGQAAVSLAAKRQGRIDLLLTDVVMQGISGRELAERFSALRPGAKVLYVSGYTDDAVVRHGILASEIHYLQKPFTRDVLARKVREVLDAPPR